MSADETLVICNGDEPVAELRLCRKNAGREAKIGVAKGLFVVPDAFFEPLPTDFLESLSKPIKP